MVRKILTGKEINLEQPIRGPFAKMPRQTLETVNSYIYIYSSPKFVVKQRKIIKGFPEYGTIMEALADQERLRKIREDFSNLMPKETPPEVLPEVTEVIHNSPESRDRVSVSWITPLVDHAKTLSNLSIGEIIKLSPDNLKILSNIIHADRLLYRKGIYMDIVGSTAEKVPLLTKLVRWWPAILWSKNIVISTSNHPPYPVFIDREGREINIHFSFRRKMTTQLYPLRLWLSEVLLKTIELIKDI